FYSSEFFRWNFPIYFYHGQKQKEGGQDQFYWYHLKRAVLYPGADRTRGRRKSVSCPGSGTGNHAAGEGASHKQKKRGQTSAPFRTSILTAYDGLCRKRWLLLYHHGIY